MDQDQLNPVAAKSRRRPLRFALFLITAAILVACVSGLMVKRRSANRAVAALQPTRDRLKGMADEMATARERAEADQRVITNVFRECRSADDIPELGSNRIIAVRHNFDELAFCVPEGDHVLEIFSKSKPRPTQGAAAGVAADNDVDVHEEKWSIPLRPSSGYWLKINRDYRAKTVRWELTGNHGDFATQSETILEGFSGGGGSYPGSGVVFAFPSQVERASLTQIAAAAASTPSIELMDLTLHGKVDNRLVDITLAVRIRSDAAACVSASEAQRRIIMGREDLLLPYQGGGKYELRAPNDRPGSSPAH